MRDAISGLLEQLPPSAPHAWACGGGHRVTENCHPPTCSPAEQEAQNHQATWSPMRYHSRVVGLEPWSHFSASSTLTIRLAASLGLGHKEPIDLPGHYRSGRSCREVCVAAVMRWGSEPDGSITESFAEKPEGRDPIGNKVGGSRRHAEGSGASQQWGLEGPRYKGSTAAGHLAAALAVPSASLGAAHGPGTHPLPTPI